jgi:hypothetical protein
MSYRRRLKRALLGYETLRYRVAPSLVCRIPFINEVLEAFLFGSLGFADPFNGIQHLTLGIDGDRWRRGG